MPLDANTRVIPSGEALAPLPRSEPASGKLRRGRPAEVSILVEYGRGHDETAERYAQHVMHTAIPATPGSAKDGPSRNLLRFCPAPYQ